MAKLIKQEVEPGSHPAPASFYIKIVADGPYLVSGNPPLDQEIILPDEDGASWIYRKGNMEFKEQEPMALCRCGASKNKPYCDGSHRHHDWDPVETAPFEKILETAEVIEGPEISISDNERYCAFARFCDAKGRVWNIVQEATTPDEIELAKREAAHCPAGRLMIWDNKSQRPYEPKLLPSLSLLEDPGIKVSGPIWVKGGIRIESSNGESYEIRNRVTLCRCGQSRNKPFCDGTHASMKFHDGLPLEPKVPHEDW